MLQWGDHLHTRYTLMGTMVTNLIVITKVPVAGGLKKKKKKKINYIADDCN